MSPESGGHTSDDHDIPVPPEPLRISDTHRLTPQMQAKVNAFLIACHQRGLPLIKVIETWRSQERQEWLHGWGRKWPGAKRTWTLKSAHTRGEAIDFAVLTRDHKIDWNNKSAYEAIGRVAEELGLQWTEKSNGKGKDLGHIQIRSKPEEAK